MKKDKIDISSLHPEGVLEKFKELSKKELDVFMDRDKGKIKEDYQEYTNCPLCGSTESEYLYTINCFSYVQCCNCEMNFVNPRLDGTKLLDRHFAESHDFMFENLLMKNFDYRVNTVAKKKVDKLEKLNSSKGKLLDIGCGAGDFMLAAKNSGWNVTGIEVNEKAYAYGANKLGLKIFKDLKRDEFNDEFDVVTLWGVIEHLKDPVSIMKLCQQYLKKDGMVVLETHNLDSLTAQYQIENQESIDRILEGDKHILNFNVKTLSHLVEMVGFDIIYVDTLGLDLVTILRYLKQSKSENINSAIFRHFEKFADEHQKTVDDLNLGDHIRLFAKKNKEL